MRLFPSLTLVSRLLRFASTAPAWIGPVDLVLQLLTVQVGHLLLLQDRIGLARLELLDLALPSPRSWPRSRGT